MNISEGRNNADNYEEDNTEGQSSARSSSSRSATSTVSSSTGVSRPMLSETTSASSGRNSLTRVTIDGM